MTSGTRGLSRGRNGQSSVEGTIEEVSPSARARRFQPVAAASSRGIWGDSPMRK